MKESLQIAVNCWYMQWIELHDPFMENFEALLQDKLPDYKFTLVTNPLFIGEWMLI